MINVVPYPNYIERAIGSLSFSNYQLVIAKKFEKAINQFNKELEERLEINENDFVYHFEFFYNNSLDDEQYIIHMDNELTYVEASSERGFFYATRTLAQLFNLHSKRKVKKIQSANYIIDDRPRFHYRSFLLDESRHFFGIDEVKKYICLLSDLKINTLHWHLSDDQGFRIDFGTFPKLKEIASKRSKTKINSNDNEDYDENEYSFCYAYHEIKEIIRFAKEHYVDIVPEIDVPGHTSAIVAAYPQLHCLGEQHEVPTTFGVFSNIICLGKEESYDFTKKLLSELCILFKDSKYIHIGGDEVSHANYEKCPCCTNKMKSLGMSSTKELQSFFSNEMAKFIMDNYEKKIIMWHDGVNNNIDKRIIMQYWNWQMEQEKINFINSGRKTIYSPCSQFYFNDPYAELPLKTTYDRGIHLIGLNRRAFKDIIGMECCVWTEWIRSQKNLEFNTNPRLHAFSEASWTKTVNHDYKMFLKRVEKSTLFDYYDIHKAPKQIYCYYKMIDKQNISKKYRDCQKEIELDIADKLLIKKTIK